MKNRLPIPQYFKLIAGLFGLILFVFVLIMTKAILIPLCFALIFAFLLHPFCKWLENLRFPPPLAAICSIILIFAILGCIVFFVFIQLSNFVEDLPILQSKADDVLNDCMDAFEDYSGWSHERTRNYLNQSINQSINEGGNFFSKTLSVTSSAISSLIILIVGTFFMLYYRIFFKVFIYKVFKSYNQRYVKSIMIKMQTVVQNYIVGVATVIAIIAILNSIGLVILGIKYAAFFGILAALLNILPYVGVIIGSILPMIYALVTKDSLWYPLGVALIFWFVQLIESNFLTPNIVGSKVSLNPFAAILAIIIGEQIWGISGMVLAIPVLAICKVIFDVIEPLKPIGYVLGEPGTEKEKSRSLL